VGTMMEETAESVASRPGSEYPGPRASILLVDDRDDSLLAVEALLKDLGQDLVKARSGEEALALLLRRDVAVILLDVRMPDMDGFETAELIRKRKRSQHTPIIFITAADATAEEIARGYAVGAVDFLFKPFMPETLKAKVRIFLELFKKTEELQENELRLRTLVANVPGLIYRREASVPWDTVFISDSIETLCGYPASDFIQRRRAYTSIIHPEDARALSEALAEAVRGGTAYALEYRILHHDGRVRWVFDRGQAVAGDFGTIRHIDGVILEITDRKNAEQGLSELLGRLLQMQDEERRRISLELYDSASPLLTALIGKLYSMRHRTRDLDPTTSRILDESLGLAEQTCNIVRNVSSVLHPRVLDESGLLASLRWYLGDFITRFGIAVAMDLPEELPKLSRDAEIALFRVVQVCLANNPRHSGSSLARVRIFVKGRDLILEIQDEGRGISQADLERAKERTLGLGAGIAAMRERLAQLRGFLEVTSDGHCTNFKATLPLEAPKNVVTAAQTKSASGK
jgi:PAS domain S-box-containing protein